MFGLGNDNRPHVPSNLDLCSGNGVWMAAAASDGRQQNRDLKPSEAAKPERVVVKETTMRGSTGST